MNQLDQLREMTTVVADTGDIDAVKQYHPVDATTNPSLILSAAQKEEYSHLIEKAVEDTKSHGGTKEQRKEALMDLLFVIFGMEILKNVPGRVSTEVDARLSFDTQGSIDKAHHLIALYEKMGISKDRVLIKLASTWEGVQAGRQLEKEGIHVNMTLMFSLTQAVACAEANATLVSPFVGRIFDWYKKNQGVDGFEPAEDPGVRSVTSIYYYFKKFGYKTEVMGASFRNIEQIIELAGCDLLTISPKLMSELKSRDTPIVKKLDAAHANTFEINRLEFDESHFRFLLNNDAMATEKLAEGIRNFAKDSRKLEQYITETYL